MYEAVCAKVCERSARLQKAVLHEVRLVRRVVREAHLSARAPLSPEVLRHLHSLSSPSDDHHVWYVKPLFTNYILRHFQLPDRNVSGIHFRTRT